MADSGAKPPKNPPFNNNAALARIIAALKQQHPGMREIDYEDLAQRIEKSEARKEREAEEAEQKRIARLEQEDADLEELEAKTKNASLSQKLYDIGYELVVPQDKMDWALLILGGIGKIGKGGKIIKILDKEKALAEIAKKRKAVQEELRASQKAKKGTVVEKNGAKTNHEKAAFGEKTAHDKMTGKGYEPVGKTNGVYEQGKTGIDGVYKNTNPPPDYIVTEVKYGNAKLEKGLADGTNQMDDKWVSKRLTDKVGPEEAMKIDNAMDKPGGVEKWLIRVNEDGTTTATKINGAGSPIRGNAGKVTGF